MRAWWGVTYEKDGTHRMMTAVVTGEMQDGTKVWTECDRQKKLIDIDKQYTMQRRNNWTEFVRL